MILLSGGRPAAVSFCATMLLASTMTGAEAKSFKSWTAPFNGANGNRSVAPLFPGPNNLLYGTTQLGGSGTVGNVFIISTAGENLKSIYDFKQAPDGNSPQGGVAILGNGTIFGSTYNGGPESLNYPGTIYKISPKGNESIVYNFCQQTNCSDGVNPNSTIVAGQNGFLYGTTNYGGNGSGILFQLTKEGQMNTSFYVFCRQANCADGSAPVGAPYVYNLGGLGDVVYGVTSQGGANGYGIVYSADYNGNYFILCNFDNTHGAYPSGGVILDKKSNIYGVAGGGDTNFGVVYKLPNQGGTPKVLYTFAGGTDGYSPVGELAQDSKGNFYGVTAGGGTEDQGTVYKLTSKGEKTILHSFDLANDGGDPQAGLLAVETKSGLTLYGTTSAGGADGDGTVFKLQP